MNIKFYLAIGITVLPWFSSHQIYAKPILSLKDYLTQVKQQSEVYRSAQNLIQASNLLVDEGSLKFQPSLTGDFSYEDDQSVPSSTALLGSQTVTRSGSLGVKTKLRTGTDIAFNYSGTYSNTYGSVYTPAYGIYNLTPVLTITQPFWKDFNAAIEKANETYLEAKYKAQSAQQKYAAQQVLNGAEAAYWQLALMRQVLDYDKNSIERTNKILQWNKRRVSMNIGDRADLLQAQAALKLRELQYQNDLEATRLAASQFNSIRNIRGDVVDEDLSTLDSAAEREIIQDIKRLGQRADIEAAIFTAQSQKALAEASLEELAPEVNLYGAASLSGRTEEFSTASSNSWSTRNPTYSVGVKLSIPLDFGLQSDLKEGHRASQAAYDHQAWRARFNLDQEWSDLLAKFKNAVSRFQIAKELEKLQEEKLNHERIRFDRGRTTSFQVLLFEENYSEALVTRLRIINDIINLRAAARLHNGEAL